MTLYESSRSESRVGSWPGHRRIRASFWNCRARGAAALVVAAVLHAHAASAGTCISPWQLRTGTALDDEIHAAVRDSDGNVYLGGFDDGLLNVENDWPVGGVSGFVEKRSNDGALLWRRVFDTAGIDLVEALALDPARHRIVVAGRTDAAFAGTNAGQFDLFVAALDDETSAVLATGQFGDQFPQHPTAIAVLPSGNIVVAGSDDAFVQGNAVLGQPTLFVAGFAPDPQDPGTFVQSWWQQPNEPDLMTPLSRAFALTAVGQDSEDVVVATRSAARNAGARLQRLDASGAAVWDRLMSPSPADIVFGVAMSGSGRLYAAGTTGMALAGPPLGNTDGFLLEIDAASGDVLWGRQFGSAGVDWVSSLALDEGGNAFIGGFTDGVIVPGSLPAPHSIYALAFSDRGEPLSGWQTSTPSPADFTDSLSIVPACDGRALIAGHVNGDLPGSPGLGRNDAVVVPAQLIGFADAIFAAGFE